MYYPIQTFHAIFALCTREMLKFVRDRSRVIGALIQPLGFWILLGLGFQGAFQMPAGTTNLGYAEFLFPGIVALVILFTAIFSTISIVEERTSGFLQAALVAPTPRTALVLGNALGGTLLALAEAALFLLAAPFIDLPITGGGLLFALFITFVTGLAFTGLGFSIAWHMESTRGFHAVMNLFLLPLWFLSGGLFPVESASPILRWLVIVNPVSYAVSGIRHGLYGLHDAPATLAPPLVCALVSVGFAVLMIGIAVYTVRQPLFGE